MKKPESVRTTFIQYTIHGVKGEGGSGTVYDATDDEGNKFAIKVLDPGKASIEKLKRFKNEFSFCSKNTHPNIIRVSDHGLTDDGNPFFVMPLYDNSLRNLIGKLNPKQALTIFSDIMDGTEAAHKLRANHRDIKPENILIRDAGKELVLADFGIADFEQEELYTAVETKESSRLANFQYAAPEQRVRGRNVDHRADIYSLGLILNELFTGEIPYGTDFNKISGTTDDYPYLDAIVEKMLRQNPESRFDSIEQIKLELISRGEEHLILQKVSQLEKTVIPTTEIDDPIVRDPMRIVNVDWNNNTITLVLNHQVNPDWQWALCNMGGYASVLGKGPEYFQFRGNMAIISALPHEAADIKRHFEQWIPKVNNVYENRLKQKQKAAFIKKRDNLQQEIQREKERADVLQRLK